MPTVERSLGWFEKYQVAKQLTQAYGTVTTTVILRHALAVRCKEQDIKEFYFSQLYAPITRLVEKHPQLSLVVADSDKSTAHFVRLDQFDLSAIIKFNDQIPLRDQSKLDQVIANECDHEFNLADQTTPLWHLRICTHEDCLDECSITFTVHHVIADGKSLATFWRDFLQEINNQQEKQQQPKDGYIIKSNPAIELGLPYEERQPPMFTAIDMVGVVSRMVAKKVFPSFLANRLLPQSWAGDYPGITDKSLARHDTVVRGIELGGTIWKDTCTTCREQGITPHAAIMTAVVSAFAEVYPETTVLSTCTPTNCRSFCNPPVPEDEMGNFVGAYNHTWTLPSAAMEGFWDMAKKYQTPLKANMVQAAKETSLLKYLSRYPEDYCDFWYGHWDSNPMHRGGGIEVSDLGKFVPPPSTKENTNASWQLESIWFCQSAQIFTTPLSVNPIRTETSLYITITWQNGSLVESKADKLTSLVIRNLLKCCQQRQQ
ncbi:alcohol acetyltransferase [Phascolomyces articulosus]|uniref:Alcohol acetyltransferase n=1 Tax=Phascolomyces articulosus TaxID=60185 RepID=A0AAD5K807_9FUNG|nr:alcohol acetyltransferase [Phascolomyces articulosus]